MWIYTRILVLAIFLITVWRPCVGSKASRLQGQMNQVTSKNVLNSEVDLFFLIDSSGSIGGPNFLTIKVFVKNLLGHFAIGPVNNRVAVTRYASKAELVLDYVTSPTNKCRFLSELTKKLTYGGSVGYMTNTNEGFKRIKTQILKSYNTRKQPRKHKKVVIYITDGNYNKGGNPKAMIDTIKRLPDVLIFSFGIGYVDERHLKETATKSEWYYKMNGWSDWKVFARMVKGQNTREVLYVPYGVTKTNCNSKSSGNCDGSATCLCGTLTGTYECRCDQGHYGHGHVNGCYKCRRGTYRSDTDLATECKNCPTKATTSNEASLTINACFCVDGYNGQPQYGNPCTLMTCDELSVPNNAQFLNPIPGSKRCPRNFNTECKMKCNEGYELDSGALTRKCIFDKKIENGHERRLIQWTESHPTCRKILCDELVTPRNSRKVCKNNNVYGSECTFICEQGYTKDDGSEKRKCQKTSKWSGEDFSCRPVTCDKLPKINNANIEDRCTSKPVIYGDVSGTCTYSCNYGYTLEEDSRKSSKMLQCYPDGNKAKGKWSDKEPKCIDTTPPKIACPSNKRVFTLKRQDYAVIKWTAPTITDNSKENITNVTVTTDPHTKRMYFFKLRQRNSLPYIVKYKAVDSSGNENECQFTIEVRDNEPPFVAYCPDDITHEGLKDNTVNIKWDTPKFFDNSRRSMVPRGSRLPGQFPIGKFKISYTAEDDWGNKAECTFLVKVQANKCPYYDQPLNGALACDGWGGGKFCTVQCQNNTEFARKPAHLYVCGYSGRWTLDPQDSKMPWPDCSKRYIPGTARLGMKYQYYDGTCGKQKTNLQIKRNFINMLKRSVFGRAGVCNEQCTADHVKVYCGKVNAVGKRTKRNSEKHELQVDFEITQEMAIKMGYTNVKEAYIAVKRKMSRLMHDARRKMRRIRGVNTRSVKTDAIGDCDAGSVFNKTSGNCVKCPVGTYWRKTIGRNGEEYQCELCPKGQFQESEGQSTCKSCPSGTWTSGINEKDFSTCKAFCKRGTYNLKTGLEVCTACPRGQYQNRMRQRGCRTCRAGTTTISTGSDSSTDCRTSCPIGFVSATGLAPCEPCKVSNYQSKQGETDCIECPLGKSTRGIAATSLRQCLDIDLCTYKPCLNRGLCNNEGHTYTCTCTDGFTGKHCETIVDVCLEDSCLFGGTCIESGSGKFRCICKPGYSGEECQIDEDNCLQNPCMNKAHCVDAENDVSCICSDGYTGKFCEEDINDCQRNSCFNGGTCIDLLGEVECLCTPAYTGANCSVQVEQCTSDPCQNNARCIEVPGRSPRCICRSGYKGRFCEVNTDECASTPCRNSGRCVDGFNAYKCYCAPGFSGRNCESKPSSDFKLVFKNSFTENFAKLDRVEALKGLSVAFWMKTKNQEDEMPLQRKVVVSYAVKDSNSAFQVMVDDVNGLVLDINSGEQITKAEVPDHNWHFYTLTWNSRDGSWRVYVDGARKDSGTGLQTRTIIPRGGIIVLGQSQDEPGDGFDSREAFCGEISKLNIWSYSLQEVLIQNLKSSLNVKSGDVVVWSDFRGKQKGAVVLYELTGCNGQTCPHRHRCESTPVGHLCYCSGKACHSFNECRQSPCQNGGACKNNAGYFRCDCPSKYNGTLCEHAVQCRVPTDPEYGRISRKCVEINGLVPADCLVQVVCNQGFEVTSGNGLLRCGGKQGEYNKRIPQCKDIDECSRGLCSHHCVNMFGSYLCSCPPGMKLGTNKRTCKDVNECSELPKRPNGGCSHTCHNTNGNFRCSCRPGYQPTASGFGCKDIDECLTKNGGCQHTCINLPGDYKCTCNHGYTLQGTKCKAKRCDEPAKMNGIVKVLSRRLYGIASFSCKGQDILIGPPQRKCQPDGKWDSLTPYCKAPAFCHKGCNSAALVGEKLVYTDQRFNSVDKCGKKCSSIGFKYFGLRNGVSCFCGTGYNEKTISALGLCNVLCPDKDGNTCGGLVHKDVYQVSYTCFI